METEFPPTGLCLGFVGILQRGGPLRERLHAIISQPQLNQTMKTNLALSIALLTVAGIATATDEKPERPAQKTKTAATQREKTEVAAMFDPIVKQWFRHLAPGETESYAKKKFILTEYEAAGLWDTMGVQLFGLNDETGDKLDYFAYSNGELQQLGVFASGGTGIGGATVSDGALYFSYGAGSGIYRVNLYKVGRGKGNALTSGPLGIIDLDSAQPEKKQFAKKMQPIISKLQPVKKGAATKPAPAPKMELPKKASAAALLDPMVKMFLTEIKPDYARDAKFTVSEYEVAMSWEVLG